MKEVELPDITVVATGGLAQVICINCGHIGIVDTLLTLKGLKAVYDARSGGS